MSSVTENINSLKPNQNYTELGKNKSYLSGEQKAFMAKYADPLTLNFKLLIDFSKTSGLFADESNINSALGFLKRIGETARYEMLKHWIEIFKIFIKDYDFLILEVIGLDEIQNAVAFEQFIEEDSKIEIKIRETSDMLIHSLITQYRSIWFDINRGVEVLPINLRRFDVNIIVFSAGYYKMKYYDNGEDYVKNENQTLNSDGIEKIIYPTLRKLTDNTFINKLSDEYNHILFNIQEASINHQESGKSFLEVVSNEPSGEYVKNNMVFNFRFASHKGRFNNVMGDIDFVGFLAILSAQNKSMNSANQNLSFKDKLKNQIKAPLDSIKKSFTKDNLLKTGKDLKTQTYNDIKNNGLSQITKLTNANSPIGNILNNMTPAFASQMIKNTINAGVTLIEQKYINDPIARVNNMLFQNFSNNLIDIYKKDKIAKNIDLLSEPTVTNNNSNKPIYTPEGIAPQSTGITYGTDNAFNRTGF